MGRARRYSKERRQEMIIYRADGKKHVRHAHGYMLVAMSLLLLVFFMSACAGPFGGSPSGGNTPTSSGGRSTAAFPTTPPALPTPAFGTQGQEAPTVKVLASVAPTLIIQFQLFPATIKPLFPDP